MVVRWCSSYREWIARRHQDRTNGLFNIMMHGLHLARNEDMMYESEIFLWLRPTIWPTIWLILVTVWKSEAGSQRRTRD